MSRQKEHAVSQITLDNDFNVPDIKPDIDTLILDRGEIQIEDVRPEKGRIILKGMLVAGVLYAADRSIAKVEAMECRIPFEEILHMESMEPGDNLKVDWEIEDLNVSMIHSRKVSIRAIVTFIASAEIIYDAELACGFSKGETVQTLTEELEVLGLCMTKKDTYRIKDELILAGNQANIRELLWKDISLCGAETRLMENKISVKGELEVFALYEGENEEQLQWITGTLPFAGNVDLPGCRPEMIGDIRVDVIKKNMEVKPDYDGEMRMFQVEMILEIHMNVYEEQTCQVLMDVYSTEEKLNLQTEEIQYERLRMCNQTKCKVSGQERLGEDVKILQILGHQAGLQNKRCKMTEQGVLCEGMLEVQILYVTSSDSRPFDTMVVSVPYSQLVEIPEIEKDDSWKVSEMLEQTSITMPEGNVLELRGIISFQACVMQQCSRNNIVNITAEPYDLEEYKNCPGMRIHFVQPKETLWGIAKENRTTVEEMKKVNDLTAEEITPGQKLLILKTAAEPLQLL